MSWSGQTLKKARLKEELHRKKAGLGRGLVEDESSWGCQTLKEGTAAMAALISVVVLSWSERWDVVF